MRSQAPAFREAQARRTSGQGSGDTGYSRQTQPWPLVPQTYVSAPETNAPKCRNAKKRENDWLICIRSTERPGPQIALFPTLLKVLPLERPRFAF